MWGKGNPGSSRRREAVCLLGGREVGQPCQPCVRDFLPRRLCPLMLLPPRRNSKGFSFAPGQSFRLVSSEQALKELGLGEHQLRFTCRIHFQDPRKEHETGLHVYNHLKR